MCGWAAHALGANLLSEGDATASEESGPRFSKGRIEIAGAMIGNHVYVSTNAWADRQSVTQTKR